MALRYTHAATDLPASCTDTYSAGAYAATGCAANSRLGEVWAVNVDSGVSAVDTSREFAR